MPKLKPETKQQRFNAKTAALLGISLDQIEELARPLRESSDSKSRQAEAVLSFIEDPSKYVSKICKFCKNTFVTNYNHVAYCTDICRKKALTQIGLDWFPHRTPEERWRRARIPIDYSIPAAALKVLLTIAVSQGLVQNEQLDPKLFEPAVQPSQQKEPEEQVVTQEVPAHPIDTVLDNADFLLAELGIGED